MLVQRVHEAGLLAEIAHEELAEAKPVRRDAAHSHQEGVGARSGRPAPWFRCPGTPSAWGCESGTAPSESESSRSSGSSVEHGDVHAAVAAVAGVELLGFEVRAVRGLDDLAAHELVDEVVQRGGVLGRRRWGARARAGDRPTSGRSAGSCAAGSRAVPGGPHASPFLCLL